MRIDTTFSIIYYVRRDGRLRQSACLCEIFAKIMLNQAIAAVSGRLQKRVKARKSNAQQPVML